MITATYVLKYTEYLIRKCRSFLMTDLHFHTVRLRRTTGKTPDIKSPSTLSEKICHRLVYDHNNVYTMLADKLAVRAMQLFPYQCCITNCLYFRKEVDIFKNNKEHNNILP